MILNMCILLIFFWCGLCDYHVVVSVHSASKNKKIILTRLFPLISSFPLQLYFSASLSFCLSLNYYLILFSFLSSFVSFLTFPMPYFSFLFSSCFLPSSPLQPLSPSSLSNPAYLINFPLLGLYITVAVTSQEKGRGILILTSFLSSLPFSLTPSVSYV